jgi:hypothetical protein
MINSNMFNFQFFLGGRIKVADLKEAAKIYNGATQYDDGIYSNIENDDLIRVNKERNHISIFVPSTINTNEIIDNTQFVKTTVNILRQRYDIKDMKFYATEGSWLDDQTGNVIVENITIITVETISVSVSDIEYFISIANKIKHNMNQQAVSISINDSLAIV